jgi:hypothetical protein
MGFLRFMPAGSKEAQEAHQAANPVASTPPPPPPEVNQRPMDPQQLPDRQGGRRVALIVIDTFLG